MSRFAYILLFLAFFAGSQTHSLGNAEARTVLGDSAYLKGKYHDAIELYEAVIAEGFESSALYYNLGNAYYKTNQIPSAILFYEKALKLDPGDENIRFNLELSRTKIIDRIEEVPQPFYKRAWIWILQLASVELWGILILISFTLALLFVAVYLVSSKLWMRKTAFWLASLFLICFLFFNVFAYAQNSREENVKEAVVFEPALIVKSSPDENSTDIFVLHEGTKVRLTDFIGEWAEVQIANGNQGWVRMETLREI